MTPDSASPRTATPVEPDSDPLALGRLDVIWCGTLGQFALAVTRTLRQRS